MTTYVIGDLQGCLDPLKRLLDKLQFDPASDKLWFVGDLINRGPQSLKTLRYVKNLGNAAITVLGNHDLHLLAVVHGYRKPSGKDTLDGILKASDRDELCHWLAQQPLLHTDPALGVTMVHAGIHPHWSLKRATKQALRVQHALASDPDELFAHMYGNTPAYWSKELGKHKRNRFAINVFTRMRYCHLDGAMDFTFNGSPSAAPANLRPWYSVPDRKPLPYKVIFGHWSSHPGISPASVMPTDRGCVWGGCLSAYAIEKDKSIWVKCKH